MLFFLRLFSSSTQMKSTFWDGYGQHDFVMVFCVIQFNLPRVNLVFTLKLAIFWSLVILSKNFNGGFLGYGFYC